MPAASLDTNDDLDAIVAGIAHDFGNILAAVTNYMALASRRIDDPKTAELLGQASVAARRAARLNRQLYDLGECGALDVEPVPLEEVVGNARALLTEVLCERCTLRLDLADTPHTVTGSRRGLEMVLRHLAQNACDAMPDGGVVTIGTCRSELTVSDVGVGMPPDVVERALEPGFSTRPKGQAGGLGLTIVARVVDRLGGTVHIDSVEGTGTTVTVGLDAAGTDG